MNIDNYYSNNQSATAPDLSIVNNKDINIFKGIIENQKDNILSKIKDSGEFKFSVDGAEYTIEKKGKNYIAKDSSGNIIDKQVQVNDNLSVKGFIEIGGIPGMDSSDRLYLTKTENGELLMIVGDAKIGDGKKEGIQELVKTGERVLSDSQNIKNESPESPGDMTTNSPEVNNEAALDAYGNTLQESLVFQMALKKMDVEYSMESQTINAVGDAADDIKRR
jgi:hypothetical protein